MLTCLTALGYYSTNLQAAQTHTTSHIRHGLRVQIDPDSGEFVRPDQPDTSSPQSGLSAIVGNAFNIWQQPVEVRSAKQGGGYAIHLENYFRLTPRPAKSNNTDS